MCFQYLMAALPPKIVTARTSSFLRGVVLPEVIGAQKYKLALSGVLELLTAEPSLLNLIAQTR